MPPLRRPYQSATSATRRRAVERAGAVAVAIAPKIRLQIARFCSGIENEALRLRERLLARARLFAADDLALGVDARGDGLVRDRHVERALGVALERRLA